MKKILICTALLGAVLLTGCSTGYRSEMTFSAAKGSKYNLGVKVFKIQKTPFGTEEAVLFDQPSNVWEHGKPESAKLIWGNDQSGIFVDSFVPSDIKATDVVYSVVVKDKGTIVHGSKFTISRTSK